MTEQTIARERARPESRAPVAPVRLCIAASAFYPVYAGPSVRFARYLPGLEERDLEVSVFSGTPGQAKARMSGVEMTWRSERAGSPLPGQEVNGVPVHRVRLPDDGGVRRDYWFYRKLLEHCRDPETRPDVVQLLATSVVGIPTLLRLRRLGIPSVFTRTMMARMPDNPVKRAILRRYVRWPLEAADCVVVSSSVMADELRDLGLGSRVEVIPNGVDTARFRPPRSEAERMDVRRSLGIGAREPVVLFVGPISPRKRIDRLLESWCRIAARHPDAHLVLVGPRRDATAPEHADFHRRLKELTARSGAADRVHFVGMVHDVERYMRTADILAFTSRREGMPNVVPEAMSAGLPVVTTPFTGLPREFGRPEEHYLLSEFDPVRFGEDIERVLTDEALRRRIGDAARIWVARELAVERSLDLYAGLYRDLAISSRPSTRTAEG